MIVLENVCKSYLMGETVVSALKGVSLTIGEGEFVSIIGTSGSGKSTLLQILGLLDRPSEGVLRIAGKDTAGLSDDDLSRLRSETIGFVFQQFHLLKRITAEENVALPLIYAKGGQGQRPPADPNVLLDHVGIGHRGHHKPNELSGGQQQRVAIARALVRRPTLILADEPTGNLDSKSGAEIMALFRALHAEGLTIILVTHEPSIAAMADRTIRMHDGLMVEDVRRPASTPAGPPAASVAGAIAPAAPADAPPQLHRWHLFFTGLQQAFRSLWGNKLRAALSALGIIIGVGAVIVMLALGNAAQNSVGQQIATLGSNRLTVFANPQQTGGVRMAPGAVTRMTLAEMYEIQKRIPTITAVTGGVSGNVQAVYGSNNVFTSARGAMPGYQEIFNAKPTYGRFFTEDECLQRARVALLGTTVLAGLFGTDGKRNPVGETILINHIPFRVIGVLPPKGADGSNDLDDRIVLPLQTAMFRVLGRRYVDWIDTTTASPDDLEEAQHELTELTREWPHIPGVLSDSYRVIDMSGVAQTLRAVTNTLSAMLASVAAISLVVGGIGIMNTMLITVTERTREIGLRKALGARGRDIRLQFLIESVALCLIGGGLGIAAGTGVTLIVGYFQGALLIPTFLSIFLSCGFSVGVGVGFGYWPAVRAARLDPITALRQE
ncbi:macrolide transport system ATP-binding/permease protein [Verrucomicrobium sp. GAS474]|uniref:ABC transporter permease n=1 Tax=Verrucomicrobium sp. GAS474 TaxID=1882831 RepID=UPI00087BFAA3|nr:ABC transporter permease [Verrucomicrobium sp. GAS474]SDT90165.1 macrolide transport system ATP-binding/permease protein [Verrucomicrobium sp. GAS474]